MILSNIETRAERQKRKEELMQMFKDRCGNSLWTEDTSNTSSDSELKD
jgi:adenosine deaminase